MRKHAHFDNHEIFIASAAIAAHASFDSEGGFRQKDLKFLTDMFSNWVDVTLENQVLTIHNTQVMRYLNDLVKGGFAVRTKGAGAQPRYKLTRTGLMGLVQRLVKRPPRFPLEHFYFVYHIVETYRGPIERLIVDGGMKLTPSQKIELNALFDIRHSLEEHLAFVSVELKKIKQRIQDSEAVTKIVNDARRSGKTTEDLVKTIEEKFPYDLNSQKPLSVFYKEIPAFMRDWILDVALPKRCEQIWRPIADTMEKHHEVLKSMKAQLTASKQPTAEAS